MLAGVEERGRGAENGILRPSARLGDPHLMHGTLLGAGGPGHEETQPPDVWGTDGYSTALQVCRDPLPSDPS